LAIVDREGGDYKAGIIRGASIIAGGEALGHGMWIDDEMLDQIADQGQTNDKHGVKVRFTHPGLSSDGMGKLTARAKDVKRVEGAVTADLHIVKSAHNSPEGNLASYVMDLAESDPDMFGMSIVYEPDYKAEREFENDNQEVDDKGRSTFKSPDAGNVDNLPHARVYKLRAADVVDEPAANPDGLFYGDEQQAAIEAEALLCYSLGFTEIRPELTTFSVDADRVSQFVSRFLDNYGLTVVHGETATHKEKPKMSDDIDTGDGAQQEHFETEPVAEFDRALEGKRFIEAFGEIDGSVFFATGLSFEAAQVEFTKKLRQENEELRAQLSGAVAAGEDEPVDFTTESKKHEKKGFEAVVRRRA
jgi:hypothetical protein